MISGATARRGADARRGAERRVHVAACLSSNERGRAAGRGAVGRASQRSPVDGSRRPGAALDLAASRPRPLPLLIADLDRVALAARVAVGADRCRVDFNGRAVGSRLGSERGVGSFRERQMLASVDNCSLDRSFDRHVDSGLYSERLPPCIRCATLHDERRPATRQVRQEQHSNSPHAPQTI